MNAPNHPPALVPDLIVARPGRLLQVPVLSNDSDPDGDALSLEAITPPDDLDAVVNDGRVQVSLPDEAGTGRSTTRPPTARARWRPRS